MYTFNDHTVVKIVVLILALTVIGDFLIQFNTNDYQVTITDKQIKADSDDYLVFCDLPNGESKVFTLNDSIIHWNFDTSDDFGRLKVGNTYTISVSGLRIPLISMYENIYKINGT